MASNVSYEQAKQVAERIRIGEYDIDAHCLRGVQRGLRVVGGRDQVATRPQERGSMFA